MPAKNEQLNKQTLVTLPNSVEAERNVLCCILRNESRQLDIISALKPDDFYQTNHAIIFESMVQIVNRQQGHGDQTVPDTVNLTTLIDNLRRNGKLAQVGDVPYISDLSTLLVSAANYDEYVSIVKRASVMRKLISVCGDITQKAYSSASAEEALQFAEKSIFDLSQGGANAGLRNLATETAQTIFRINQRFKDPDSFRGIQTGFTKFDRMTNGLHGGELIVLAARPGVGKSAMAMNIAEHVARQGKTVAVFSLEMSNDQIIERMLSAISSVPLAQIKSGQLENGNADITHLRQAQDIICTQMKLYGNDYASISPAEIASQCRRLKAQEGLDLIIIDYIQLMASGADPKQGRQNEVATITRNLKLLAKDLNVPVIALSQLKRDAEIRNIKDKDGKSQGGSEPVLSDLRESGAIEQDADIVLFIHKEPDADGSYKYKLIIAKHRNGEQGDVELYWLGSIVRFADEEYLRQHNIRKIVTAQQPEQADEDRVFDDSSEQQTEFITDIDDTTLPEEQNETPDKK